MNTGQLIILITVLLIHLILAILGTLQLSKSTRFTKIQIRYNIILLWIIPFLWYLLIRIMHKKIPGSHEVPIKNDVSSNNSYESGLGAPGAGISNRGY